MPLKKAKTTEEANAEENKVKRKGKGKAIEENSGQEIEAAKAKAATKKRRGKKDLSDDEEHEAAPKAESDVIKSSKATVKKKKGKKGDVSEENDVEEPQKSQSKTKAPKKKQKADDNELLDNEEEEDKVQILPVKKPNKKKQKAKGKTQDWTHDDEDDEIDLPAVSHEIDDVEDPVLPEKKSKKKPKPKKHMEDFDDVMDDEVLEDEPVFHNINNTEDESPANHNADDFEEDLDEEEGRPIENGGLKRMLDVTYVIEPRLTRSHTKGTKLPAVDIGGVTEKVQDLKIDNAKSKSKATKSSIPVSKKTHLRKALPREEIVEEEIDNGENEENKELPDVDLSGTYLACF